MSVTVTPHDQTTVRPASLRVVGWALVACWIGLVISTVVLGHRASTFAQLEADVAAGRASEVHTAGGLRRPDSVGFSVVQVQWRSGMLQYSTDVLEARPRRQAAAGRTANDVTKVLVDQTVAERLAELDPDLPVATTSRQSWDEEWEGWTRPAWVTFGVLGALGATVLLLVHGPSPRGATRWAWFWLTVINVPLGALAYLLLSGATSPTLGSSSHRRLTGGWAFLLALLVDAATGALLTAVL